jgi:hypothetical protein
MLAAVSTQCQKSLTLTCPHRGSRLCYAYEWPSLRIPDRRIYNRSARLRGLFSFMADPLYLSLWFPDFSGPAMLPHMFAVLQQFPFSEQRPGVTYAAVQPVSWNEATVLERRFVPGISPEEAVVVAADLIHDDYAYVFDGYWDLWTPNETGQEWQLIPSLVKFIVQGEEFDDGACQESGHIEIDFGLDSLFVQETVELTEQTQAKIRDNLAKLVEFTRKAEMNTRATSRRLWSESEESLPQKLIARLQKVQ